MTIAELIAALQELQAAHEAEVAALRANQLPTGVVNITITGVDMTQVKFEATP